MCLADFLYESLNSILKNAYPVLTLKHIHYVRIINNFFKSLEQSQNSLLFSSQFN